MKDNRAKRERQIDKRARGAARIVKVNFINYTFL